MKSFIYIAFALLLATVFARNKRLTNFCQATGDPHYISESGARFDVYNTQGEYELATYPNHAFDVQSRMYYKHPWANRALQWQVAMKIENVRIESVGGTKQTSTRKSVLINGKKMRIPFTKRIGHITVRGRINRNRRDSNILVTSSKHRHLRVLVNIIKPQSRFVYHDVYLTTPKSWGKPAGFCGIRTAARNPLPPQQVKGKKVHASQSLFSDKFVAENHPAKRTGHVAWKNDHLKQSALKQCADKYKLKGANLKNCLYDIKIAGSVDAAAGYADTNDSMKELMAKAKKHSGGYLYAVYVLVVKMRRKARDEHKKASDVLKGLETMLKQQRGEKALTKLMLGKANFKSVDSNPLLKAIRDLASKIDTLIAVNEKKAKEQREVIADAEEELSFIKKVLKYIGDQIEQRKKSNFMSNGVLVGGAWSSYKGAEKACKKKGMRLLHASEICDNGRATYTINQFKKRFPALNRFRDIWLPVSGDDWVQVRDGRMCTSHNAKYGRPNWGNSNKRTHWAHPAVCVKH